MAEASEAWLIVGRSLIVSGSAVGLSAALGVPLRVGIGLSKSRWSAGARLVFQTGMALPPVVVGLLLYILFSRSGPLAGLGWLFTMQAMIAAQVILSLPFVVAIAASSVRAVPPQLEQQLRSLGASRRQARRMVVREARPGILMAVAAALGRSLSEVGAVQIVGGNIAGQTRVMTTAIVLDTSQGHFQSALALGAVLVTFALAVNTAVMWLAAEPPRT